MTGMPEDALQALPHERLESVAEQAAAEAFALLRDLAPGGDDRFYGFSLCTDCDVGSFYWAANTEARHRRTASEWLRAARVRHPESGATPEQAEWLYRYDVRAWSSQDRWLKAAGKKPDALPRWSEAVDALGEIWDAFEALPLGEDAYFEHAEEVRSRCLQALVEGLKRFDRGYDWPSFRDRDEFLLLVWVNDPDDPDEVREMARALNPPTAFAEFSRPFSAAPREGVRDSALAEKGVSRRRPTSCRWLPANSAGPECP